MNNAISIVEQGFDKAESGETSKSTFMDKDLSKTSEETIKLCRDGRISETIDNATMAGVYGNVTLNGNGIIERTSDNAVSGNVLFTASFSNFSDFYRSPSDNLKNIVVSGNAQKESTAVFAMDIKSLCDAALSGSSNPSLNNQFTLTTKDRSRASLSLSGSVGGAVTFDYTEERITSGDGQTSLNFAGTASFKSGGTQVNCTVGTSNAGGFPAMDVSCE